MTNSTVKSLFHQGDEIQQYKIVSEIKPGTRNSVYKAFIPGNEKEYFAIKAFPYTEQEDIDALDNEVRILDDLKDDESIVHHLAHIPYVFLNQQEEDGKLKEEKVTIMCIVMNFYDQIDLMNYFRSFQNPGATIYRPLKIDIVQKIFYKTLKILNNIHQRGIVHHDIKPDNFLIKSIDPFDMSLTDFEFSIQLLENETVDAECGTIRYMAPEILNGQPHDISVDIWSLGVMIYYFAFGFYPCSINSKDKTIDDIRKKVNKHGKKISYGHDRSPLFLKFRDLIKKLLAFNPDDRITAEEALKHDFFEDYNDLASETKEVASSLSAVQIEYEGAEKYEDEEFKDHL